MIGALTTLRKSFDQFGYILLYSAKNLIVFPQSLLSTNSGMRWVKRTLKPRVDGRLAASHYRHHPNPPTSDSDDRGAAHPTPPDAAKFIRRKRLFPIRIWKN